MQQFVGKCIKSISLLPTWDTAFSTKQKCEQLVIIFDDGTKLTVSPTSDDENASCTEEEATANNSQYLNIKINKTSATNLNQCISEAPAKNDVSHETEMVYSKGWFWRSKPRKL